MGRLKGTHHQTKYVNGKCRNEAVKCTEDELEAMSSELCSGRNLSGKKGYQRRLEYVMNRRKELCDGK